MIVRVIIWWKVWIQSESLVDAVIGKIKHCGNLSEFYWRGCFTDILIWATVQTLMQRKTPCLERLLIVRPGVSIIFKNRVFYKAWFKGFEFFIVWPFAVFHKMQVVFYKSAHFMYLWSINSVFAKCDLQSSKILK